MNMVLRVRAAATFVASFAFFDASASAEALSTAQPLDLHLGRLIIVLLLCIALAIAAVFILKRASSAGKPSPFNGPWLQKLGRPAVTILESRRISVHADVCRLAYAGREYLVVVSQGGATVLKEDAAGVDAAP